MNSDIFFEFFNVPGKLWIVLAIAYALIDILYNSSMCWLTGGLSNIQRKEIIRIFQIQKSLKDRFTKTLTYMNLHFKSGGLSRWEIFKKDPIAFSWPFTVLAIPTALYGITHSTIINSISELQKSGINLTDFRLMVIQISDSYMQYVIWFFAIVLSVPTLFRYRHKRSVSTFFSDSLLFNSSRIFLFNIPLAYMIFTMIFLWLDYYTAVFRMLSRRIGTINPLNQDLMYGLSSVYDTLIGMSFVLLVLSLLPSVILFRERKEKYSWQYKTGIYSGIVLVMLLIVIIFIQFDNRLEIIKTNALAELLKNFPNTMDMAQVDVSQLNVNLNYYLVLMNLPDNVPIPFWFEYMFGARLFLLLYELINFVSPNLKPLSWLKRLIE
jgi:hypothetical protein